MSALPWGLDGSALKRTEPSPQSLVSTIPGFPRMHSLTASNRASAIGSDFSCLALSRSALNSGVWHWYWWRLTTAPSTANRQLMR